MNKDKETKLLEMIHECSEKGRWQNSDLFKETEQILDKICYGEIYHGKDKDIKKILKNIPDDFNLFDVEKCFNLPYLYWYHDKNFDSRMQDKEIYKRVLKTINDFNKDMDYPLQTEDDLIIKSKNEFKEFNDRTEHIDNGVYAIRNGCYSSYLVTDISNKMDYTIKKTVYVSKDWKTKRGKAKIEIDIDA